MQIKYEVKTLSPILLSADSGEVNTVNTYEYISGNSILGIFASKYIRDKNLKNAHEDSIFRDFFINGKLKFLNAYIQKEIEDEKYKNYPIPFSIQKEKYKDKVVIDLLCIDEDNLTPQTQSLSGFASIEDDYIYKTEVKKITNFHNSIKEDQLFHYSAIQKNQIFQGEISGDKDILNKFIEIFGSKSESRIGRSKTSQYSNIEIDLKDIDNVNLPNVKNSCVITLVSDLIIYNKNGFSSTKIEDLEEYIGFKINKSFIKIDSVENFVGVWGLRKPSENCFLAGSSFEITFKNEGEKIKIKQFFESGLGERTNEGYGRFLVNYQTNEELTLREYTFKNIKPKNNPNIQSIEIVKFSIKKYLIEKVNLKALLDMDKFSPTLTNSLLGRLNLILNGSKDDKGNKSISIFIKKIEELKKNALDKLEASNNKRNTLLEHIELFEKTLDIKKLLENYMIDKVEKISKSINYDIFNDPNLKDELIFVYLNTFFSGMIKKNNRKEKSNDR